MEGAQNTWTTYVFRMVISDFSMCCFILNLQEETDDEKIRNLKYSIKLSLRFWAIVTIAVHHYKQSRIVEYLQKEVPSLSIQLTASLQQPGQAVPLKRKAPH